MTFYKVVYAKYNDIESGKLRSYKDWLVDQWLEEHCRAPYYHDPGWTKEKFIQFENSEDAVNFALRWS
jgi:hypothetical protein